MRLSSRSMVWLAGVGSMLLAIPALAQSQGNPDTASYTSFDSAATGAMFRWYVTGTTTTDITIAQHGTVTFTNPSSTSRAHNVDFASNQKPQCKLSTDTAASRRRCRPSRPRASGRGRASSTNPAPTNSSATTRSIPTWRGRSPPPPPAPAPPPARRHRDANAGGCGLADADAGGRGLADAPTRPGSSPDPRRRRAADPPAHSRHPDYPPP